MDKLDTIIKRQIQFKIDEIDKLFSEYELIFKKLENGKPDLFDMTILGSVLHSFYNGVENIFETIAKNLDKEVPTGNKSHQELLHQMASENNYRQEVISEELYMQLREYATFRHFYRHAYSFQLNWNKMEPLIDNLFKVWKQLKEKLQIIIELV